MRECFLFTSYANTPLKLKTSIDNLKKLSELGTDICIYSHYPITEEEQRLSNFSIYDKDNPIPPIDVKASVFWNKYKNIRMDYYLPVIDYAIILQWVRGIKFLLDMGYELIHVINYDISLNSETFSSYRKLVNNSNTFLKVDIHDISTQLFSVDRVGGDIITKITYDDYINSNQVFGESFLSEYILPYSTKFNFVESIEWGHMIPNLLETEISMDTYRIDADVFGDFNLNDCRLVVGNNDGYISYLLYNVKSFISLTFDDVEYSVNVGEDLFIKTDIPFSDNLLEMKICVNGIDVNRETMLQYLRVKLFNIE